MRPTSRILASIAAMLLLATLPGAAHAAAASATIEQTRNGVGTAVTTPIPAWVSGNAGGSNSHYLESHSNPYRTVMIGLPTNGKVVELTIGYAVKKSDSYAIDYLTSFQRLMPHVTFAHTQPEVVNPLAGVAGVSALVTTAPIPLPTVNAMIDPDGADSEPSAPQPATSMGLLPAAERMMTLYGGTLIDVTYVSQADVSLLASTSETLVKIRFTANSSTAVLAWGGHLASRWEWGFNADGTPRSAGGISGSSYHMRLVTWNLGSLGNQDRSLSTDAVIAMPRCGITNQGPFCANSTNTHVGPTGMTGYQWSLLDNTSGATIVGSDTSKSVVVNAGSSGSYIVFLVTSENGYTKQCQATVTVKAPPTADAGADQAACSTSPQAQLAGVVGGGATGGLWSGGAGTYNPSASTLNAIYTPTATEIAAGGVTLTLTASVTGGTCPPATDQVRIAYEKAATANAGVDIAVCASSPRAQLAGIVGGGASGGSWSGGAGTFTPSASALNATYDPTPEEIAAGGVTLTLTTNATGGPCPVASDAVRINVQPAATADAGLDRTVCSSAPAVQLAGVVGGGASSGGWSGGAGTYNPNASTLNATYTPTAAEIAAGGVTLTLATNDPAGPCGAVTDAMRITYSPAATANAGLDAIVCATSPNVTLAGVIGGGASSGTWSGGAGTFNPSASALNATYTPTAAEIAAGAVTLTLTSDAVSGPCAQASDQMTLSIRPAATANAGQDRTVCASAPAVQLAGAVGGGASSGGWSGGAGTFNPNASTLNATYTPTAAEIAAGGVTLTLTTNDPTGPCGAVSDAVRITYTPAATANAGADVTVCSSNPKVTLAGVIGGGASSGTWSGGAGSFNPSASVLNATYTPSAAEIAAGTVTLTLTSDAVSGPCGQVSDQMTITIMPAATANAGLDRVVCSSSPNVQLAGLIGGGASGGTWSGGTGSFNPGPTQLDAVYTPSAVEIAAGVVTLTLTTNDPLGPCGAVSDQVKITINAAAVVDAGADVSVCSSSPQAQLNGSVGGGASGGTWSGGAGTFSPSASTLNAKYTPTAAEITAGSVTLTLTSAAGSGPCPQVSDRMIVFIYPAATVNAGADQITCADSGPVQLAGSIGGSATSATWSGGAGGAFIPNASTLNATYTPTAADIAAGSVTLTLTTNDPAGVCGAVNDQVRLTLDQPVVTVADRVFCAGMPPVQLCANVSRGIAPYTYLWNNGATTSCITVPDAGVYTVTITDAKGCQASGSGTVTRRDCPGLIAHTSTTCNSFSGGVGDELLQDDIKVSVTNNVISGMAPGVMFYWSKIRAPRADFRIDIQQIKTDARFPYIDVFQGQVTVYDQNCGSGPGSGAQTTTGQVSVDMHGAIPGQTYIVAVKYSLKSLIGTYMDPTMGCHYDFHTVVDGLVVDADPDGFWIGVPQQIIGSGEGTGGSGDPSGGDPGDGGIVDGGRGTGGDPTPAPTGGGSGGGGGGGTTAPSGRGTAGGLDAGESYASSGAGMGAPLERPVPNPFVSGMRMAYAAGRDGEQVDIAVYDLSGRRVKTLENGIVGLGRHDVAWDGRDESGMRVRSGMYFIHVRIGTQARQVRVTFVN